MDDLISRQMAIRVVKGIDSYFVKYIEQLPSAQPDGRYINADELIKRLKGAGHEEAAAMALKMAGHERKKNLPSAQSEIIRCKDCIYWDFSGYCVDFMTQDENGFCSWAERRTDCPNCGAKMEEEHCSACGHKDVRSGVTRTPFRCGAEMDPLEGAGRRR